jgi:hypothetical protein
MGLRGAAKGECAAGLRRWGLTRTNFAGTARSGLTRKLAHQLASGFGRNWQVRAASYRRK